MTAAKAKVRDEFGGKKIFELWCASALRRFVLARWIFDDSGADYHDLKALARFLLRVANLSEASERAPRPSSSAPGRLPRTSAVAR